MNKLFTLFVSFTVAASSAMAADLAVKHERATCFNGNRLSAKKTERVAKVQAKDERNWPSGAYKSLGSGKMADDMLTALFGYSSVSYSVEIQQSEENASFYRVIAPYGESFAEAMKNTNGQTLKDSQYDKAGERYIDIDASDPDDVYFAKTYTGCDWGYGEMYIGITSTGTVTLKDGIFTATIGGIAAGDDDGAYAMNRNGKFYIALPGAEVKDYTIELSDYSQCLSSREFTGKLTVGSDIAKVKYYVFANFQEDEVLSTAKEIAADGVEFTIRGAFSYQMDEVSKETLIVVGVDENDQLLAYDWVSYYYIDDDPDGWESAGTAKFTDSMWQSFFPSIPSETLNVELQRNKERPDYLRLVNPYNSHSLVGNYIHGIHNHYIYIDAEDPEIIFLDESPVGMDFGYGLCRVSSGTRYFVDAGFEIDECKELEMGGVIEDNVLSFPEETLLISMFGYENGDWLYPDENFTVEFPEGFALASGVHDVSVDAASQGETTYYNLQGVKVSSPTPGTLVIRRQGNKAEKFIAK